MCHPVFLLDLPQLPSLPMFLPHPGPPYLPPAKQPPKQQKQIQPVATLPTLIHVEIKRTNGSSTSQKPPLPVNSYPYYKKDQTITPKYPPIDSYNMATETSSI